MKHFGDITKIHGYDVPPVDIITGGSPCQDLSVAGKRAGLAGERSGLFMDQIRIVKEMRDESKRRLSIRGADYDIRYIKPRYMVWENVAGAFTSGNPKGADFGAVLEEIVKVVCKECPNLPIPKEGWHYAGSIDGVGDDGIPFSIAWRLHDAQYWGVPQRRRRISLVADFGGISAPSILFERKSLSGNTEQSRKERQGTSEDAEGSFDSSSYTLKIRGGAEFDRYGKRAGKGALIQEELSGTLGVSQDQTLIAFEPGSSSRVGGHIYTDGKSGTIRANYVVDQGAGKSQCGVSYEISPTLSTTHGGEPCVLREEKAGFDAYNIAPTEEKAKTLTSGRNDTHNIPVIYGIDRPAFNQGKNAKYGFAIEEDKAQPLVARGPGAVAYSDDAISICHDIRSSRFTTDGKSDPLTRSDYKEPMAVCNHSIVRRLTPKECERLQGYPDDWTNIGDWTDSKGKVHKLCDSPRYKALGNSIALPFWEWMAERMLNELGEENPTMGSLFDGIGGFPLVYSRHGCTPVWASEIEEFPIAVTKKRFPEK